MTTSIVIEHATGQQKLNDLPATSYVMLVALIDGPKTGYDIKQNLHVTEHIYHAPAKSQIYAELRRLAELGLATTERVEQRLRPDKTVYTITQFGYETAVQWLGSLVVEPDDCKSVGLFKLFHGMHVPVEKMIDILTLRSEVLAQHVRTLNSRYVDAKYAGKPMTSERYFEALTIQRGIHLATAERDWSGRTIDSLIAIKQGQKKFTVPALPENV